MKIKEIKLNRDKCTGAASCVAVCPNVFGLDDENKVILKDPKGDTDENILLAAQSCPVGAITIIDEDGKQVYP